MWLNVFFFVASMVIGELLRPKPKGPQNAQSAGFDNVQFPTAQEGRVVPVIWGTQLIKGANLLWYGDYQPFPIIKTQKIKKLFGTKKKKYIAGYRYHIGLQLALCHGTIDALQEIRFEDKVAWRGDVQSGDIEINEPFLFGGDDKGGGVAAIVKIYPGDNAQPIDPYLESQIPIIPAHRGLAYLVWQGPRESQSGYIGTTPNIRPMHFVVKRVPQLLSSYYSGGLNGDANPAEMIFEILTNQDWGLGLSESMVDVTTFNSAAGILKREQFGLSMTWDQVSTIESVIDEILRHIEAELFVSLTTGQYTLQLIRDNQENDNTIHLNPSNVIRLDSFQRASWDETTNEVRVNFNDRDKGFQPSTAAMQDLANYHQQQKIVSQQVQYSGCSNQQLAAKLALRDLRALSLPLAKVNLTTNRVAHSVLPGYIVMWDWPDLGIQGMRLRVAKVGYGDLLNGEITLSAVQDVFSLPDTVYSQPQPSGWQSPIEPPEPIIHQRVIEAPYFILATHSDIDEPETARLITLAARPSVSSSKYLVITLQGRLFEESAEVGTFTPTAALKQDYPKETDYFDQSKQLVITAGIDINFVQSAAYNDVINNATNLALLGDEFIAFTEIKDNGDGTYTLNGVLRGLLDTVPQDHSTNDRIWFLSYGFGLLEDEYQIGNRATVKYLPVTSKGVQPINQATALNIQIQDSAKRPYPPGDVKINDESWPTEIIGDIVVTWADRNRETQLALTPQNAHSVTSDEGVSYTVKIFRDDGKLIHAEAGLSEGRFVYDQEAEKTGNSGEIGEIYWVRITSESTDIDSRYFQQMIFSRGK
jgi:hypothetical protein